MSLRVLLLKSQEDLNSIDFLKSCYEQDHVDLFYKDLEQIVSKAMGELRHVSQGSSYSQTKQVLEDIEKELTPYLHVADISSVLGSHKGVIYQVNKIQKQLFETKKHLIRISGKEEKVQRFCQEFARFIHQTKQELLFSQKDILREKFERYNKYLGVVEGHEILSRFSPEVSFLVQKAKKELEEKYFLSFRKGE